MRGCRKALLQVVRRLRRGVRICEGPATTCQLRPNSRHILISRQFIGDAHDEFADIGISDGQSSFLLQLGGHCSDFFSGEPTGEEGEQGDVVLLRNPLRVARPQPIDDCAQEWWQ